MAIPFTTDPGGLYVRIGKIATVYRSANVWRGTTLDALVLAVLGQYDFVNVVEAPDEQTIARISLELSSRGTGSFETLTAIPVDDFIAGI